MFTEEQLEQFQQAYIDAMLWSSTDESNETGGEPLDRNYDESDLTADAMQRVSAECQTFLYWTSPFIAAEGRANAFSRAGHDFWLTRNGHGAGFWDGGWPKYGDLLTKQSRRFPGITPYATNDGEIDFD